MCPPYCTIRFPFIATHLMIVLTHLFFDSAIALPSLIIINKVPNVLGRSFQKLYRKRMKVELFSALSLMTIWSSKCFEVPTNCNHRRLSSHLYRPDNGRQRRQARHVCYSMAVDQKSWKDLHEFNVALDKLAELSGSSHQPVILKASECQTSWEDQEKDPSNGPRPDTISFNTVLKAWNRCCQVLSDLDRNPHKNGAKSNYGHSVPVYTPRDAAERATTLLLRQMEKDEGAKPDTASFNVVIGTISSCFRGV